MEVLGGDYRFYVDDWGIQSHTFVARFTTNLSSAVELRLRARYYTQTGADFYAMTAAYLDRAVSQNVRHAEVFISPQAHLRRAPTWKRRTACWKSPPARAMRRWKRPTAAR